MGGTHLLATANTLRQAQSTPRPDTDQRISLVPNWLSFRLKQGIHPRGRVRSAQNGHLTLLSAH